MLSSALKLLNHSGSYLVIKGFEVFKSKDEQYPNCNNFMDN